MEFLDKTGLAYFWGKVKEKLTKKADNDKYKIINISTNKVKFASIVSEDNYNASLFLDNPDMNNFAETFPSGYHILCILAVKSCHFVNETNYNNNIETEEVNGYSILPIQYADSMGNLQRWSLFPGHTINMYGTKDYYTLLLEKD